ncbi:hypothetical protein ASZ90_018403 [hydrocarbon metagenome]|uniref:Uncharacterized protein n=1 Tax=hydrocarbon metagenome TaxID=938273 RepID=A0A0W8E6B3_9ZZZZ
MPGTQLNLRHNKLGARHRTYLSGIQYICCVLLDLICDDVILRSGNKKYELRQRRRTQRDSGDVFFYARR